MDTASAAVSQGAVEKAAKSKRDRRLHLSTWHMIVIAAIITVFAFMIGFTKAWGDRMDTLARVGEANVFKDSEYATITGGKFTPEDLKKARVTAFNVWATTCPPCIQELPELEKLNHEYPEGEFQVVGILNDSTDSGGNVNQKHIEDGCKIVEKAGVTFPTLVSSKELYAFLSSNIMGTPTTFFVDSEGNVIEMVTGSDDYDGWKAKIDSVLSKTK